MAHLLQTSSSLFAMHAITLSRPGPCGLSELLPANTSNAINAIDIPAAQVIY